MPANSVKAFKVLCSYKTLPQLVRADIQQESDLFIFDKNGTKLEGMFGKVIEF